MSNYWWFYFLSFGVGIVVHRLNRLGKQLEAVGAQIRADLAQTDDERREIIVQWQETQKQVAKDARNFWIFWGGIGAAALIWSGLTHKI